MKYWTAGINPKNRMSWGSIHKSLLDLGQRILTKCVLFLAQYISGKGHFCISYTQTLLHLTSLSPGFWKTYPPIWHVSLFHCVLCDKLCYGVFPAEVLSGFFVLPKALMSLLYCIAAIGEWYSMFVGLLVGVCFAQDWMEVGSEKVIKKQKKLNKIIIIKLNKNKTIKNLIK